MTRVVQDVISVIRGPEDISRSKTEGSEMEPCVAVLAETGRCMERLAAVRFLSDSASSGNSVRFSLVEACVMRG